MPADLTREEIDDYGISLVAGLLSGVQAERLLAYIKNEPTRIEAARQEGYREGVEAALAEFDVEVHSETFRHGARMRRRFDSEVRDAIRALLQGGPDAG